MYIYIMRHGEAVQSLHNDSQRNLTEIGRDEASKSACWLQQFNQQHNTRVSHCLVSPYVRAQQTLECVSNAVPIEQTITLDEITPAGNYIFTHHYIDGLVSSEASLESLLVVSHMPFVTYLVEQLCAKGESAQIFATGALVCIDYDIDKCQGHVVTSFIPQLM